ncbi:MAG TPA: TonB-dependent receptor [Sphingobium sp.]
MLNTRRLLFLGTALAAAPTMAMAQAASPEQAAPSSDDQTTSFSLDRLIVSAGAEKVAIDTPQAVTALDQEDIDQQQASTIGDLLEGIPGVSIQGGVGQLGQGFNIRGLGSGIGDPDSRVVITVDGVQKYYEQYRMGGFFSDPELYKRVEVLRGPASSTLYGNGALGGVVNFTTKDAADFLTDGGSIALRLKGATETNAEAKTGSGILAFKPVENLELLGTYNIRRSSDYRDGNGNIVAASKTEADSWLGKARYNFSGDRKHAIWVSYQDWISDTPQVYDQVTGAVGNLMRRRVHDKTGVVGYVNDFNGSKLLNVEAQLSYADSNVVQTETNFLTNVTKSTFGYESWQAKVQNTSQIELGGDWKTFLIVGGQWIDQTRTNPRVTTSGTISAGAGTHPEGGMTRYGLFGQLEIVWSDKLTIMPGVRVDWTDLRPGATTYIGAQPQRTRHSGVSPKIAALYNLTDWFGVFGSYAHTVKLPNIDETFSSASNRSYSPFLRPEKSDNVEAGFTLSFDGIADRNDRLRAKTTFFQNDVKDLIQTNSVAAGVAGSTPYFVNVGRSRIRGVELEAEYGIGGFFARGNLSIIDGKNLSSGQYLFTIPANEYHLTVGYADARTGLSGGWTAEFADAQNKVPTSGFISAGSGQATPGYNTHSVFLTFRPQSGAAKGVEFRISAENIFDTYYRRYLSYLPAEGQTFKFTFANTF